MKENLIPHISQKIEKVLKKEKLKVSVLPQEFIEKTNAGKHRYFSVCKTKKGKKRVFYARIQKNKDAAKKVRKEAIFAILLQRKRFQKKIPFLKFLPKYYKGKIEKDFEWIEREFIKEKPIGDNELLNKKLTKKQISEICEFLWLLSKTNVSSLEKIPLEEFPFKNYKEILYPLRSLKEKRILNKKDLSLAENFLKENIAIFKREHKYFSHGDFNLGNIIFTQKGLKVIDWESMEINNFAYDIAYLFCHLWQAKKWQRRYLIERYLDKVSETKKEVFKILFRGDLLFLLEGGFFAKPKEIKTSQLKERRNFFAKAIKASLRGFEKILLI